MLSGMVVFDLGEHDDALALLSELRAHESVIAARASRTERRFELDVMRR